MKGQVYSILMLAGTLALITSGVKSDEGASGQATALAIIGVFFFAACAALFWRDKP